MCFLMITIKRQSKPYTNALQACNESLEHASGKVRMFFSTWLIQYGGRLITGWDIEFDNHEDAAVFILKYG